MSAMRTLDSTEGLRIYKIRRLHVRCMRKLILTVLTLFTYHLNLRMIAFQQLLHQKNTSR